MEFRDATKAEVFDALLRFYRQRLGLPEDAVFPTTQPLAAPVIRPGGDFWVGIAPGDGQVPFEEQDDEVLRENTAATVMAYIPMQLDPQGRDATFLFDPQRGAFALQAKLLLIVGQELTDENGVGVIASRVFATGTIKPDYDAVERIGWVGIRIGLEFDWKIEGAEDFGDD